MGSEDKLVELQLDYLYKEYSRLSAVGDDYAKSSFDDFKLLGAVGLVLAWDPIVSVINGNNPAEKSTLLLLGFVAILLATAIVATRDLLKQSLIIFHQSELGPYEDRLRTLLHQESKGTFRGSERWKCWFSQKHKPVAMQFYGLCVATVVLFPLILLFWKGSIAEAITYAAVTCVVSIFPGRAMKTLYGKAPGTDGGLQQSREEA